MPTVPRASLRARLLLLLILAVLLPTGGLLVHIIAEQRQLADAAAQRQALRLVHAVYQAQGEAFIATRQLLLSLSRLPLVDKASISSRCQPLLAGLLGTEPYFINLGIADADGRVLCSALPIQRPVNIADRAYFRRALRTGDFANGNYQIGRITGQRTINFAAPVIEPHGKPHLFVFAAVGLSWLNQMLSGISLPAGTIVIIADSRGTILGHFPDPQLWIGRSIAQTPLMQIMQSGHKSGTAETLGLDGIPRLFGYAPLQLGAADAYYLAAGIPQASAFAPMNRSFLQSAGIFTILALISLATAWIGCDVFIVRRLKAITSAARRLARGDMTARTGLEHGSDELGTVAHGFDNMAERIEHHHAQLDAANTELKQINHALLTLGSGNRTLVRAVDELSLLREMCRVIVETGGYRMAWVGYAEHDEQQRIRPIAQAGLDEGYLESLRVTWADTERGRGPGGTAVRTGTTAIARNILTDARFAPWREDAMRRGYSSNIALPLKVHGQVIGVLGIYSVEPEAFADIEVNLLEELAGDLAFGIETLRIRSQSEKAHETIWRMAYYDAITGLPNHARLEEFLQQMLLDVSDDPISFALLLLDIDQFRDVNDALGTDRANGLLREIGLRIRNMLPDTELLARMRGDEFAILLPQSNAAHAVATTQRVLAALEEPFLTNDISIDIRVSVGIVLSPQHGNQADCLMRRADLAVRRAKESDYGYAMYDAEKDDDSPRRLALAADLRQAIDGDQLLLYYQPKIDMRTGRLSGVEALARWNHPQHGAVPPDQFIPLAERTGLIRPLTYRVLEIAARQSRQWLDRGFSIPIAVNLSARNLRDPALIDRIMEVVNQNSINCSLLEFEITETVIMEDPAVALDVLTRLNGRGIALSIDDFGTGYSSLSYLKKLPADSIKIDRSFVLDMLSNKDSGVIVRSTIALAHDLGLAVVAEGIESAAIWHQLAALGCDIAQGYHVGHPMPASEFEQWLRQSCRGNVWDNRAYVN